MLYLAHRNEVRNAISGFATTGIFPVDSDKYPQNRIEPDLLKKYKMWKESGSPLDWDKLHDELNISEEIPHGGVLRESQPIQQKSPILSTPPLQMPSNPTISTDTPSKSKSGNLVQIGPQPYKPPPGFMWIPKWELTPISAVTSPLNENKSFEEIFLEKVKPKSQKEPCKRQKLDLRAQVVSQRSLLDAINEKEREKERKEKEKAERKRLNEERKLENEIKKIAKKKKTDDEKEKKIECFDENDEEHFERDATDDESEDDDNDDDGESEEDMSYDTAYLEECWKKISPPTEEETVKQQWFACIFNHKKVPSLYLGKAEKRFLNDEGGLVVTLQLNCLERKYGSTDNIFRKGKDDVDVFPAKDVIAGPVRLIPLKNGRWKCPSFPELIKLFEKVKKVDREALYQSFVCKELSNEE